MWQNRFSVVLRAFRQPRNGDDRYSLASDADTLGSPTGVQASTIDFFIPAGLVLGAPSDRPNNFNIDVSVLWRS
jgi:hypothetical protein